MINIFIFRVEGNAKTKANDYSRIAPNQNKYRLFHHMTACSLSLSLSAYRNAWLCLHAAPLACFNIIVPHTVNVYSYQSNEGFAKDKVCRGKNIWNFRTSISCHGPHIKLHLTNQHTHTQPAPNYDFSLENKTHFFHITCRFMSVLWDFRFSLLKKCSTSLISSLLSQSHRI